MRGLFLPFWQVHMLKEHQSLTIRTWDMRTLVTPEMAQEVRRRALDPSLRCWTSTRRSHESCWDEVTRWIEQAIPTDVRRIVDLGAGTGVGTFALAGRFVHAEVIAVDASDEMLERVREKASDLGLAERIKAVQADLDTDWPETGPVDLTWASMFMHHLTDVDGVLKRIHAATRDGGLIVIAEFTDPPRFLPDDLGFGEPGLESRCIEAFKAERLRSLPSFGLEWGRRLEKAGFSAIEERVIRPGRR